MVVPHCTAGTSVSVVRCQVMVFVFFREQENWMFTFRGVDSMTRVDSMIVGSAIAQEQFRLFNVTATASRLSSLLRSYRDAHRMNDSVNIRSIEVSVV